MENNVLYTDFSSLDGQQSGEWMQTFMERLDTLIPPDDTRTRVLGNLLVMERFINTLRQGLAEDGLEITAALEKARVLLWDYVKGRTTPNDFEDFANDLYACSYAFNVGDISTDAPKEFAAEYFADQYPENYELIAITWISLLLMELVVMAGGRKDFEELEECKQISFYGIDEMLNTLEVACTELAGIPPRSNIASDLLLAMEQVRRTPLFCGIIKNIQTDLKTALSTSQNDLDALQEKYSQYTILPAEYAKPLLEY